MIPYDAITAWSVQHPWPARDQVEQDLLLSRAICAIAANPYLRDELVFRGGTALHKIHLAEAYRYSEDLDYVRASAGGIGELTRTLTDLGESLGYSVRTRVSVHPKILWRTTSTDGTPIRLKIEVNTHERTPSRPLIRLRHEVSSPWWSGNSDVLTFQPAELVATKIRALYQRSKGRDLFDLWLALVELRISADEILDAFGPYRPEGLTARKAVANLEVKRTDAAFRTDLDSLLVQKPEGYSVDAAAQVVSELILAHLD